ncbi:MAG: VanZ family protein [Anaerolineales bacterium]|nr:VanZ family protein [Anaerolineales bacterium]
MAWLLAVLYSATDEFHQSFVPGRHAAVTDVLVFDSFGAMIALLCRAINFVILSVAKDLTSIIRDSSGREEHSLEVTHKGIYMKINLIDEIFTKAASIGTASALALACGVLTGRGDQTYAKSKFIHQCRRAAAGAGIGGLCCRAYFDR